MKYPRVRTSLASLRTWFVFTGSMALAACSGAQSEAPADSEGETIDAPDLAAVEAEVARSGYVDTPGGSVHKSCLHELADGDLLDENETIVHADGTRFTPSPCAFAMKNAKPTDAQAPAAEVAPTINGWVIAGDEWKTPRWVGSLFADWTVPRAPSAYRGQLIYLFPSLEDGVHIIQPVLQYGNNGKFGGKNWVIASWWGPDAHGNYFNSTPRNVAVGDHLHGQMVSFGCSSGGVCTWDTETRDASRNFQTTIRFKSNRAFRTVNGGVLEAYRVTACNQFPASGTHFGGVNAYYGPTPSLVPTGFQHDNWTAGKTPQCGYRIATAAHDVALNY